MASKPIPPPLKPQLEEEYKGLNIQIYFHDTSDSPGTLWRGRVLREKSYWEHIVTCADGYILSDTNDSARRSTALKEARELVDDYLKDPSLYRDDLTSTEEVAEIAD